MRSSRARTTTIGERVARPVRLRAWGLVVVCAALWCAVPVWSQPRTWDANALIAEGLKLARAGEHARAALFFQQAVDLSPTSFNARYNLALAQYNSGNYRGAEGEFGAALRLNPQSAEARRGIGLTLIALNRHADAVAHLREAVRLLPTDAPSQAALGRAYLGAGNPRKAVEPLQAALRIQPDSAGIAYDLGRAAEACRDFALARSAYARGLARKPDSLPSALGLARVSLELRQPLQATEALRPFVPTRPQDPGFWRLLVQGYDALGLAEEATQARLALAELAAPGESAALRGQVAERYMSLNLWSAALPQLQLASQADPGNAEILVRIARCHRALGDTKREITSLRSAAALAPADANLGLGLATALSGAGAEAEALAALERALAVDPVNLPALRMASDTCRALGRLQEREQYLRRILALNPRDYPARLAVVDCLVERGQPTKALLEAHEALMAPEPPAEAFIKVARLAETVGSREIALEQWKELARRFPDRAAQSALEAARILIADHRALEAVELCAGALAAKPEASDLELALARTWQAAGRDDQALPILEQLVARMPDNAPARAALAEALAWLDRFPEATGHVRRVLAARKLDASSCRAVATVFERSGEPEEAWAALEQYIPDRAPLYAVLSSLEGLYSRAGRAQQGGQRLAELARANPDRPEIALSAASLLSEAGLVAQAETVLLGVSGSEAWRVRALRQLAGTFLAAGAPDKALEPLRHILEPDPAHVWVIVMLLELQQRPDMAAQCAPVIQRMVEASAGSPAFWIAAADLAGFLQRAAQTIPRMRALTLEAPGDPGPATGLAALCLLAEDPRGAELAIAAVPEALRQDRALFHIQAAARLELGDAEGARECLERAARGGRLEAEDHLLLAEVEEQATRHELRLWHLSRALILDPVSDQARAGFESVAAGRFLAAETLLMALSDVYYHVPDAPVVQDLARQVALDTGETQLVADWQVAHPPAPLRSGPRAVPRTGRAGLSREGPVDHPGETRIGDPEAQ